MAIEHSAPVRVFIGTSAGGEDAEAAMVCHASLAHRASGPVEVALMALSHLQDSPYGGWRTDRWATPWTGLRWAVPELCGWEGRAVYLDAPTIVLGDVVALASAPMPKGSVVLMRRAGARMQTDCMVFDCAAAKKWIPSLAALKADVGPHQTVGRILSTKLSLVGDLPPGWGGQDADYSSDPASVTGSVHCALTAIQPHQFYSRGRLAKARREHWFRGTRLPHYCKRLVDLFAAEYQIALREGYAIAQYVPDENYGRYVLGGK